MSILWALRKFVDPVEHVLEDGERKQALEPEEDRDPGTVPPRSPGPLPEPVTLNYRCRVCSHESGRGDFCPRCLAATMERAKGR
jgi:hypothetical protein